MNLSKIHYIAIIVSDYEASKDFYVNKLGFAVIRENYRPERKEWKLDIRVNELTELEIFAEENPPKRVNRPEACGLRHLAFCVDSVEQTVKELTEVGIECEPIRVDDYTGKKMTFFYVGIAAQYVIEDLAKIPVRVELGSEFRYRNPLLDKNGLVVVISQSGETADSLAALEKQRKKEYEH